MKKQTIKISILCICLVAIAVFANLNISMNFADYGLLVIMFVAVNIVVETVIDGSDDTDALKKIIDKQFNDYVELLNQKNSLKNELTVFESVCSILNKSIENYESELKALSIDLEESRIEYEQLKKEFNTLEYEKERLFRDFEKIREDVFMLSELDCLRPSDEISNLYTKKKLTISTFKKNEFVEIKTLRSQNVNLKKNVNFGKVSYSIEAIEQDGVVPYILIEGFFPSLYLYAEEKWWIADEKTTERCKQENFKSLAFITFKLVRNMID